MSKPAPRSPITLALLGGAGAAGIALGAWGLSQRLRPRPMPPALAFLLESRLTRAVVGPELVLDRAGVGPGMRVLDAGCGPGRISLPAGQRVLPDGHVVALDAQSAMLDKLTARIQKIGAQNVTPLEGELGAGDPRGAGRLADYDPFDRVLLTMVTGELRYRRAAHEELYGALAAGGLLSVTETLEPDYRPHHTVRAEFEGVGFEFDGLYKGRISYTMNFVKR